MYRAILIIDTVQPDDELEAPVTYMYKVKGQTINEAPYRLEWLDQVAGALVLASDEFICSVGGQKDGVDAGVSIRNLLDFSSVVATCQLKYPRVDPVACFDSESKHLLVCGG